jgi:hypothetical protein
MWNEVRDLRDGIDYGTPPRGGKSVTLTVDGAEVTVPEGSSVMLAATEATDIRRCVGSGRMGGRYPWRSCDARARTLDRARSPLS